MTGARHRLLLVINSLERDGGKTRFLTLAETLRDRGGHVTILAGPGPLEDRAAACGVLQLTDWSASNRTSTFEAACRTARGQTAVVIGAQPALFHLVPGLALEAPVHLCLHAQPGALEAAFERGGMLDALSLLPELSASGRVLLSATCMVEARTHAARLGLPDGAIASWPNGVTPPAADDEPAAGPVETVAVVSRLADVKLPIVAAAAELVALARARGRDVVLDLHGSGPAEGEAHAIVAARLPDGAWRSHGATDRPLEVMRRADAVVATGRTAIEALMIGRRVVVAAPAIGPVGQLGVPVTEDTFDLLRERNFSWSDRDPLPAADVWDMLEATSPVQVAAARDLARRLCTAEAMLDRELELLDDLTSRTPDWRPLVSAAGLRAAALEGELVTERQQRVATERRRNRLEARLAEERRRRAGAERDGRGAERQLRRAHSPATSSLGRRPRRALRRARRQVRRVLRRGRRRISRVLGHARPSRE